MFSATGVSVGGYVEAEPPDPPFDLDTELEGDEQLVGVLRAVVDADEVTGQVLTPKMSGTVSVYQLENTVPIFLMTTGLKPDGTFTITAPDLEPAAMRGGRLVIRVEDHRGRTAEGFVSIASFAEIRCRAGLAWRQLLALVAGNETPADVAVILSWFHEDPRRLAASDPDNIRGAGEGEKDEAADRLVTVAALGGDYSAAFAASKSHSTPTRRNWSRFINQILEAFRDPRGPLEDKSTGRAIDDDDETAQGRYRAARRRPRDRKVAQLLQEALRAPNKGRCPRAQRACGFRSDAVCVQTDCGRSQCRPRGGWSG